MAFSSQSLHSRLSALLFGERSGDLQRLRNAKEYSEWLRAWTLGLA